VLNYGYKDLIVVVPPSGEVVSEWIPADYVHSWATKCPDIASYQVELVDKDDYGVYSEFNATYTGPTNRPVERKCVGFKIHMTGAAPGSYDFRVMIR